MLSVCNFLTLFFFWIETQEMKTHSIWKHLVVCYLFISCSGVSICSRSRDSLEQSGGAFSPVYILTNVNRSETPESTVTGEAQWKESLGEAEVSSLWRIFCLCNKGTLILRAYMGGGGARRKYGGTGLADETSPWEFRKGNSKDTRQPNLLKMHTQFEQWSQKT